MANTPQTVGTAGINVVVTGKKEATQEFQQMIKTMENQPAEVKVDLDLEGVEKAIKNLQGIVNKMGGAFDDKFKFSGLQKSLDDSINKFQKFKTEIEKNGKKLNAIRVDVAGLDEIQKTLSTLGNGVDTNNFKKLQESLNSIAIAVKSIQGGLHLEDLESSFDISATLDKTSQKLNEQKKELSDLEKEFSNYGKGINKVASTVYRNNGLLTNDKISMEDYDELISKINRIRELGGDLSEIRLFNKQAGTLADVQNLTNEYENQKKVVSSLKEELNRMISSRSEKIDLGKLSEDEIKKASSQINALQKALANLDENTTFSDKIKSIPDSIKSLTSIQNILNQPFSMDLGIDKTVESIEILDTKVKELQQRLDAAKQREANPLQVGFDPKEIEKVVNAVKQASTTLEVAFPKDFTFGMSEENLSAIIDKLDQIVNSVDQITNKLVEGVNVASVNMDNIVNKTENAVDVTEKLVQANEELAQAEKKVADNSPTTPDERPISSDTKAVSVAEQALEKLRESTDATHQKFEGLREQFEELLKYRRRINDVSRNQGTFSSLFWGDEEEISLERANELAKKLPKQKKELESFVKNVLAGQNEEFSKEDMVRLMSRYTTFGEAYESIDQNVFNGISSKASKEKLLNLSKISQPIIEEWDNTVKSLQTDIMPKVSKVMNEIYDAIYSPEERKNNTNWNETTPASYLLQELEELRLFKDGNKIDTVDAFEKIYARGDNFARNNLHLIDDSEVKTLDDVITKITTLREKQEELQKQENDAYYAYLDTKDKDFNDTESSKEAYERYEIIKKQNEELQNQIGIYGWLQGTIKELSSTPANETAVSTPEIKKETKAITEQRQEVEKLAEAKNEEAKISEIVKRISKDSSIREIKTYEDISMEAAKVTEKISHMYDDGITDTEEYIALQYKFFKLLEECEKRDGGFRSQGFNNKREHRNAIQRTWEEDTNGLFNRKGSWVDALYDEKNISRSVVDWFGNTNSTRPMKSVVKSMLDDGVDFNKFANTNQQTLANLERENTELVEHAEALNKDTQAEEENIASKQKSQKYKVASIENTPKIASSNIENIQREATATTALTEATDKLIDKKKEESAIDDNQSFSTSFETERAKVDEVVESEKSKFDELKSKLDDTIPKAINEKNEAFTKEQEHVHDVVEAEKGYLDGLKYKIKEVNDNANIDLNINNASSKSTSKNSENSKKSKSPTPISDDKLAEQISAKREATNASKAQIKNYEEILRLKKLINETDSSNTDRLGDLNLLLKNQQQEYLNNERILKQRRDIISAEEQFNKLAQARANFNVKNPKSNESEIPATYVKDVNTAWSSALKENEALEETKTKLSEIYSKVMMSDGEFEDISKTIQKLNSELTNGDITLKNYLSQISSIENSIAKNQKNSIGVTTQKQFENLLNFDTSKNVEGYVEKVNAAKEALRQCSDIFDRIQNGEIVNKDDIEKLKIAVKELQELKGQGALKENTSSTALSIEKLLANVTKYYHDNSAMASDLSAKFEKLIDDLRQIPPKASREELEKFATEFQKLRANVEASGKTGKSFFAGLTERIKSMNKSFIAMYFSLWDIVRYTRNAFNTIKELDTAMVDLKKTTAMNSQELDEFYKSSNAVARQMGVSTAEIINQASAWSRLGFNTKEQAETMARVSSQFAAISPGMSTEEATDGLVSVMKAFDIDAKDALDGIASKINIVGKHNCPKYIVIYI